MSCAAILPLGFAFMRFTIKKRGLKMNEDLIFHTKESM